MLQVLEWLNCYKSESSVVVVLIATLKMTMFVHCDPYLSWPETWLENDKGMDKLNYSTASVHCVAASIKIRLAVRNIKIVLPLYPVMLRLSMYFSKVPSNSLKHCCVEDQSSMQDVQVYCIEVLIT